MVNVGFIQPSSEYLFDPFRGDPFTHYHILTILDDHFGPEIKTTLIDLRGIKKEYAQYHIPECNVYLHSVYTLDYEEQFAIVNNLRILYPRAIHIAGGPHVAEFIQESLKLFESVIIGEGEIQIIKALQDLKDNKLKKLYQESCIVDIDSYPYPRRHYLPPSVTARKNMMSLRKKPGFENLIGTTVIFSRGCPYFCHFCAIRQARDDFPGIRFYKPGRIEAEIEYLKKEYGIQALVLQDEIGIPLRKDISIAHLNTIGKTNITWRGQCRIDGITPGIAKLMHDSGCIAMGMGVESVNQISLDIINKHISVEQSKRTIALLKENDIEVRVYMIIGLPGEPENIVDLTWNFIEEVDPDLVVLSLFTIRPGTEIFRHPERFGIKKINTDWSKTMHMASRYDNEEPTLTFEYNKETPWGKSIPPQQIIKNYLELQQRLKEKGISTAFYKK